MMSGLYRAVDKKATPRRGGGATRADGRAGRSVGYSRHPDMRLLDTLARRKLLVVTGKGGVGKTAVSAVLGRHLAQAGRRVLVVDDNPLNCDLLVRRLRRMGLERIDVANDGDEALDRLRETAYDLVLLDVMMPGIDGFTTCRRLKERAVTARTPVIFMTALTDTAEKLKAFEAGAVDYITKPISPPIVLARVRTHLQLKRARDILSDQNVWLEGEVRRRMRELQTVQDATIMAMASLAETRDNETGNHIRRTQHYVRALALAVREHPRFRADLADDATVEMLYKSAPLHDIGKVGIPDHILLKPGKLTDAEFEIMKTHTTLGRDAIVAAEALLAAPDSFLRYAREIAYCHHEKWDGSGYPQGLAGEAIPLSARLMAAADVYDALISVRVYKPAYPHERAIALIRDGRGTHFDPDVADAVIDLADTFNDIAVRFADEDETLARDAG
ncbi:MAG TPA: two-component system response regulator [Acidobacteria bacterium]|nr:two-component system response regulator [Acidobacteriota bacterium]